MTGRAVREPPPCVVWRKCRNSCPPNQVIRAGLVHLGRTLQQATVQVEDITSQSRLQDPSLMSLGFVEGASSTHQGFPSICGWGNSCCGPRADSNPEMCLTNRTPNCRLSTWYHLGDAWVGLTTWRTSQKQRHLTSSGLVARLDIRLANLLLESRRGLRLCWARQRNSMHVMTPVGARVRFEDGT